MNHIKQQPEHFVELMKQHAAEMSTLSRAFDKAVEAFSKEHLASAMTSEKAPA